MGAAGEAERRPPVPERHLYEQWGRDDGLPQISVRRLAQDSRGYLWVGTEEGLARFDGQAFSIFDRSRIPQLLSNRVDALIPAHAGGVWATFDTHLLRLDHGRVMVLHSPDQGLPEGVRQLSALLENPDGSLWVGTRLGVLHFDHHRFTWHTTTPPVLSLHRGPDGEVWVGTEGTLQRLTQEPERPPVLSGLDVRTFADDPGGDGFWAGTSKGLFHLKFPESSEDGAPSIIEYGPAEGLHTADVYSLFPGSTGLWIATRKDLYRFGDGVFSTFDDEHALPAERLESLWEDHEQSLWIGSLYAGLTRMRDSAFSMFGAPEGLVDDLAWTIHQQRSGTVWVGTVNGATRLGNDGGLIHLTTADGLPGNDVRSLMEDSRGHVWLGTLRNGAARWHDGELRTYGLAEGLADLAVVSMAEDSEGTVWLGTKGGLSRFVDGGFQNFSVEHGLPNRSIWALEVDPQGGLWIGTPTGLARLPPSADLDGGSEAWDAPFQPVQLVKSVKQPFVRSLHLDGEGTLWIGTAQSGLARWRDGETTFFTVREGLFDNLVHQVLGDQHGYLWMTSNRGISRIHRRDLEGPIAGPLPVTVYDESDGMRSSECNGGSQPAGMLGNDGRLWFPTLAGVAVIDSRQPPWGSTPPPPQITEVLVDQEPLQLRPTDGGPAPRGSADTASLALPAGTRDLEIRYAALTFLGPGKLRFRQLLEPLDSAWVEVGARRSAFYTNLDPGPYRFRVMTCSSNGLCNDTEDSYDFIVEPAWHQTWFFRLFTLAGLGLAVWTGHRMRTRGLKQRNAALEQTQRALEQRTQEMERFVYAISHDLENPLVTIRNFAGKAKRDVRTGRTEHLDRDLDRISRAADTMDRLLCALIQVSSVRQDLAICEDISLAVLAREARERFKAVLDTRGIDLVIDPTLPRVSGDPRRLRELLVQLVANAIEFMGSQEDPQVRVGQRRRVGEEPVFFVQDNGMGISDRYRHKVFEIFEKLDPQTEGTGIGLALSRRIVEAHGGKIWVESGSRGQGSTFLFTLPSRSMSGPADVSSGARRD